MKKSRILFFCDAASGKTLPKAERAARKALPSDCTKRETHSAFVLHFPSPYLPPLFNHPAGRRVHAATGKRKEQPRIFIL